MTNLKAIATTCLAVTGLAMAQDNASTSAFPTPSSSSSSSSAVAAPRTGLYGSVVKGSIASDNTVDDYSMRPTLIGDKQYVAGFGSGANLGSAAFSFKGMGLNLFGAVTGAPTLNTLRLGAGSGTAWGGGLLLAVDRTYVKNAAGETTTYFEPSGFGAFGDFSLGNSDAYGQIGWNTGFPTTPPAAPHTSVTNKPAVGAETTINHHGLDFMLGWKKDATTEGTHSINIALEYLMAMHSSDGVTPAIDDNVNVITLSPSWGYIVKANSDYSVFVGTNGSIMYETDKIAAEDGSQYTLAVMPNFAFQKQLGKGFEGFSGFSVTGSYHAASDEPVANAENSTLLTGGADVAVGLRWVKDNFAFEGSMSEALLTNGPAIIGGGAPGMFLQAGISLGI